MYPVASCLFLAYVFKSKAYVLKPVSSSFVPLKTLLFSYLKSGHRNIDHPKSNLKRN